MGPRTLVRGNLALVGQSALNLCRFNGAAHSRARKFPRLLKSKRTRLCFNGAAHSRARKYELRYCIAIDEEASMGPRTLVRGNFPAMNPTRIAIAMLQWGRALSCA